ncbi:MAG: NADH-quinone oxidoreductase subunit L [Terriglobales bacterium]
MNLWLIPLLPLTGAAINGLLGKNFSRRTVSAIALFFSGSAFAWSLVVASKFSGPASESVAAWIQAGAFRVNFGFYLDQLSLVMILVVTGVGFLIHVYSAGYMAEDQGYYRFFSYLNLFMFFMLALVLADNYLLMFVGWEGVGLASYLLIGFWFTRDSAAAAGKKAFIVNRIGDFGFLIGMFLMVKTFGSLEFAEVFPAVSRYAPETTAGVLTAIALLLLMGAAGKSAQVPLYVWLPDAMEGPTPVSALIHAATMVTAGVYMVARSSAIFSRAPEALTVVAVIGCITALLAATIGVAQTDIKRVLAYSTVSQLGYMFLACGVAAYSAGMFHLMTHAFFKALLFLGAGSVIHALSGEQDMRHMGGLRQKIPWTFAVMTVATFTIAGFPPLSGFFSKDEILWKAFSSPHGHPAFWMIGIITAALTSFYMFRLWFLTFFGERREATNTGAAAPHGHSDEHGDHVHESPWVMLGPLVVLAALSVVGGWAGIPHALGGHNYFEGFLAPVFGAPAEAAHAGDVGTERLLTGISVIAALFGFGLAWLLYAKRPELPERIAAQLGGLYQAVLNKYYVDEGYDAAVVRPVVEGSRQILWRGIDVGMIDDSVNAAARGAQNVSRTLRRMQSGNIRSYAGWVALGAAAVLTFMIWMGMR